MSERAAIRPWPRWMRAETAAEYVGEPSVEAFLARIPRDYPEGHIARTSGERVWAREDLHPAPDQILPPVEPDCLVYFVQSHVRGPIKIGFTRNAKPRLRSLQLQNAEPLKLLHKMPGSKGHERFFHGAFAKHRLHGEWFKSNERLLECISRLKSGEDAELIARWLRRTGP